MTETQNNLCDIKDFKEKKAEKHFITLARNFIESKDYDKAMRISYTAHRLFPDSKEIIFTYAQSMFLCGYENKAAELFEQIEDYKEPFYAGNAVFYYLADCYCWQKKNLLKALKYINMVIKTDKANFCKKKLCDDFIIKGRILYALGNYNAALHFFKKVYNFEESEIVKIYLSKIYLKKGEYLKGYFYFKKILDLHNNKESIPFNYEEILCYLNMKLNYYTKENKIKINPKIKKSLETKIGIFHLKDADCLIYSNKYAVALKYDGKIKPAPFVVYKSNNIQTALKKAKNLNLPIFKDKIANNIYKTTLFDETIERKNFKPIAEILAEIYNNRK